MKDQDNFLPFGEEDLKKDWEKEWVDMPEFVMKNKEPVKQLIISFNSWDNYFNFEKVINQKLTCKTQSVWYPTEDIETYIDKRYTTEDIDDES